jgi:hypothetical protein
VDSSNSSETVVRLSGTCLPDRDFIINYKTTSAGTPGCTVVKDPDTGVYAAMISFIPEFLAPGEEVEDMEGSGEYLFVIDRSGSMHG